MTTTQAAQKSNAFREWMAMADKAAEAEASTHRRMTGEAAEARMAERQFFAKWMF